MIDDAEQLLTGPKAFTPPTPNNTHCQCYCQPNDTEKPPRSQEPHNRCCLCCCCNCCCSAKVKSCSASAATTQSTVKQTTPTTNTRDISETAEPAHDIRGGQTLDNMEDEDERHSLPFDIAAKIVEYRHKDNCNNKNKNSNTTDNSYLPMPCVEDEHDDDTGMRYSYKGVPPETYSAKKEFIYTRPLVEKQLVLKKTCEWWFYKNKCANMSTHWRRYAFLFTAICILLLLAFIIYVSFPMGQNNDSQTLVSTTQMMTTFTTTTTTIAITTTTQTTESSMPSDTTPYLIPDLPNIRTEYINHSFIGDEQWSGEDEIENDINEKEMDNSIPDDLLQDFVKPRKVHNFTLNADDLLYESKRNSDNNNKDYFSAFSVTGTFRSESSQIWDPHPEYLLNVFNRELHLVLHQDTSFIPPKTFRVLQILNNRTVEETEDIEGIYLGCFYKGYVQGDDQSAVAVSLCNGMSGYIKTSFGSLLIQPVNQTSEDDAEWIHKVWRHSRRNARQAVAGTLDFDLAVLEEAVNASLLSRRKRNEYNENSLTLEVLLAVDRSVHDFHKVGLKSYILTLISMVSKIFDDASLGNNILISVASILVLRDDISTGRNASQLLKYFCAFLARQNYHYDTAMLITRDPICRNANEQKCDTLGLAEMGTVCKPHSCSIVQDNGLAAAFTIAHELGHILNMPHDDDERCRPFNDPNKEQQLHIMSSIMTDNIHPFSWSNCSRFYVSEFLEKMDRSCLEDTHAHYISSFNDKQPGELYSLDQQCRLMLGSESSACMHFCRLEGECKRLWCTSRINQSNCQSSNLPWADGTPCRNNHHWCQRGECVPRDGNTRELVHGGWSPWSSFTPCSLMCGGGVQESRRDCNNPLPANGGKYCKGSRKKFRSCNTQSCSPGAFDAREQQCADFNDRNITIPGLDRGRLARRKWIPKYVSSDNRCKRLYCRLEGDTGYFPLSDKVKDGTTCSYDTFDKCVNGVCRPAGCDNELNSVAKLDRCGVCEGNNNTCEEYNGNFYVSNLYELQPKTTSYYYYVTTIPKGASNIVITQPGYHNVHYIVLRDDQNQTLLNGNKIISTYPNIVFYAGVMFEYNGARSVIERVNTTYSRKLKRDLIVEIISMNSDTNIKNDTILMTYTYTYDKPSFFEAEVEIYRWEMQAWSNCDALCQGTSHRTPVCISTTMARKVGSNLCEESAQPPTEYRNCNTECVLTLNVTSISECSAACGNWGTREKTHNCVQTFLTSGSSNIVDLTYCMAKMEVNRHEPCREGCWDYTEWSQCSRTCGTGTQVRSIACLINQTRVDESYCNARKKVLNDVFRICTGSPCPRYNEDNSISSRSILNNWVAGEWGECNDRCEKNRTISCRYHNGYGCNADRKPLAKRKCCQIKYVSNWSNCSVECGNGIRRKELHCARVYKAENKDGEVIPRRRVYIDPSNCRNLRAPTPKRTQKPCKISCKWSSSDWTQCRHDCSEEYQSRSVYCESVLGNTIAVKNCDASKKPLTRKICNNCVRRQSRIISSCTCDGYRKRRTVCYDSTRKRIPCPTKERIVREKCLPPTDCQPQSCEDLRNIHRYYHDREYTIYVKGQAKRVYCHNMRDAPKEYITVNPIENYSIYYDYKTDNPDKCPPESRKREYRDTNINSGRTSFHKIRVNMTSLRVVEDDFTFATTIGFQQPLGSAGDCYNRNLECPQGDFSINIDRSGFTLRPGTMWERRGNYVAMKTSQTFDTSSTARRAFCGGFCGRCAISHLGLYLEVV